MKKLQFSIAITAMLFAFTSILHAQERGYNNAPYKRYEADTGTGGGNVLTNKNQNHIAYEASERKVVELGNGQSREWTNVIKFRGIVVRAAGAGSTTGYSGKNASAKLYINDQEVATLTFYSNRGWINVSTDNNPNYSGKTNGNPRMRYDEQRYLHNTSVPAGAKIKIVSQENNLYLDFIEIEDATEVVNPGYATYNGGKNDKDALQNFINSNQNIYLPTGIYNINGTLEINGTKNIQGAGMWFTTINFTNGGGNQGGFWSYNNTAQLKDVALTRTTGYSRSNSYKGINGIWGRIERVWVERFECGAWFGNNNCEWGGTYADGMVVEHCRFRNNYADGINFCYGTRNSVARYCNFRNNGDDDMAIWPAGSGWNGSLGGGCDRGTVHNNTFEYNTAEHCWMASSCALYGGYGNKWQYIKVQDNYEVGIRVNNIFNGYKFDQGGANGGAENSMSNIDLIRCGTTADAYNNALGAIDLDSQNGSGTVRNIRFSCIDIKEPMRTPVYSRIGNSFGNNMNYCGIKSNDVLVSGLNNNTNCSCTAVVNTPVNGVSFTQNLFNINVNSQVNLASYVSVTPSNATNKNVSFSIISGSGYINLNPNGTVTGTAEGTATVQVKTEDGDYTSIATINVAAVTLPTCTGNVIVQTPTPPTIDGTIDAVWSKAPEVNIAYQISATESFADYAAKWRALYDNNNVYVLVEITKPTAYPGFFAPVYENNMHWWTNSDAVEIYFDGDNSKNNDGNTDLRAYRFRYNQPTEMTSNLEEGSDDIITNVGVMYKTNGNYSWLVEVAIPWENVSVNPTADKTIGFDVTANIVSDATSNGRKGYFTTFTNNDPPVSYASQYGNVTLKECSSPTDLDDDIQVAGNSSHITAYGNTVEINGIEAGEIISVYNLLGMKIYSAPAIQDPEFITSLNPGVYLVVIEGTNTVQKVIITK